jgi:tryptophan 2,3-dioxygenase
MNPDEQNEKLRFVYDRGSVYETGTFVTRMLDSLTKESELICHDERMFQLLHLQTEVAWYNIHFELRAVIRHLQAREYADAMRLLDRIVRLAQLPIVALETMVSCMSQYSLLAFRALLPDNATGIDSPGMINLRYIARVLWREYELALEPHGFEPGSLGLARARQKALSPEVQLLANVFDQIQQLDIKLMNWKQIHLRMVWMHLGGAVAAMQSPDAEPSFTGCPMDHSAGPAKDLANGAVQIPTSLRGRPITELQKITSTPLFPKLWKVPDLVFQEMNKDRVGPGY